jgi:hypothetical protein
MIQRKTLIRSLVAGLVALPVLALVGCSQSAFNANEAGPSESLAQAQAADSVRPAPTDPAAEDEFPLDDCAKANSKKVLVCHVPPGNPDAKHTICVSEPGAVHGHGLNLADPYAVGGHGGDRLGDCAALVDTPPTCADGDC